MTDALAAYETLRADRPELFVNPPDAGTEILFDVKAQHDAGVVYQDPFVLLVRDTVRFRDGRVGGYIRLLHTAGSAGAAILAIYQGEIVLLRHFRHATRTWHWEIPRGFAEQGEATFLTASRETEEELGVRPYQLRRLGRIHTDTGLSPAVVELFLADLQSLGLPEHNEGIDLVQTVSPEQFDDMTRAEEITDSFTIAAVAMARLHGLL